MSRVEHHGQGRLAHRRERWSQQAFALPPLVVLLVSYRQHVEYLRHAAYCTCTASRPLVHELSMFVGITIVYGVEIWEYTCIFIGRSVYSLCGPLSSSGGLKFRFGSTIAAPQITVAVLSSPGHSRGHDNVWSQRCASFAGHYDVLLEAERKYA